MMAEAGLERLGYKPRGPSVAGSPQSLRSHKEEFYPESQQELGPADPLVWGSWSPECEGKMSCCLSHPVCGTSLSTPWAV